MGNLEERINKLKKPDIPKSQKEENGKEEKIDRRKFNKRHPDSGRKPKESTLVMRGIKQYLQDHYDGEVEIEVTDPKTGKKRVIKKPRVVRALERLYEMGIGYRTPSGEYVPGTPDALNKWLDRALGKPLQPIGGDEERPILLKLDF